MIVAEVAILAGASLSWSLDVFGGVVLSRTDYRNLSLLKGFIFRTLCLTSERCGRCDFTCARHRFPYPFEGGVQPVEVTTIAHTHTYSRFAQLKTKYYMS